MIPNPLSPTGYQLMSKKPTASFVTPRFKPLNKEQADAYKTCRNNHITFLTGPAGCSKTFTAVAYAIDSAIQTDRKIVLSRPAIEACGESLGALPGTASEKLQPYLHPLTDSMNEYAPHNTIPKIIVPLAHLRGRTFKHSIIILDEAQNANMSQLKMLLTRIGENSQIIICGDWDQSDIRNTPLRRVAEKMATIEGISHFNFLTTVARHPLIPSILDGFDALSP